MLPTSSHGRRAARPIAGTSVPPVPSPGTAPGATERTEIDGPPAAGHATGAPTIGVGSSDAPVPEEHEALVWARGLVKRFGDHLAVDHVDFDIGRGESFGFLGPNGAGKTSTMRMISCLSPVSDGTLRVLGMDPAARRPGHSGPPRGRPPGGHPGPRAHRPRQPHDLRSLLRPAPPRDQGASRAAYSSSPSSPSVLGTRWTPSLAA